MDSFLSAIILVKCGWSILDVKADNTALSERNFIFQIFKVCDMSSCKNKTFLAVKITAKSQCIF